MSKVVLDASALLALIHREPGQESVADALVESVISAVNLAEVIGKLAERGVPQDRAKAVALSFGVEVVPLDRDIAAKAGQLRPSTRSSGLSLGDRCCLATAMTLGLPALTAEAAWEPLADILGVEVRNIRPRGH
ncbi:MAG: type II toxin-antitoxin system VapC family toxin [Alphaproteobacteria bacterium]|nr:type II toxin-antitoxin system VapC family toxin [Alphaproteobacteria bacterium]